MGVGRRNLACGGAALLVILLAVSITASAGVKGTARDALAEYEWAYLRGGLSLQPGESPLELVAVGDTSLARGVDPETAFSGLGPWLHAADITFANLECVLSAQGAAPRAPDAANEPYRLVAPPSTVEALRQAGFDIVSLANNHTLDAGPAGLVDTVNALETSGIAAVGVGKDIASTFEPRILDARGIQIAFLAFNAVSSPDPSQAGWTTARWERETALAAVRRATGIADAVVVALHWGYEYEPGADPVQLEWARALVAAGAALVIGSHPHTAQELLVQARADGSSGLAALSLGNFAFDQAQGETRRGLALRAFFDRNGLRAVQALPVHAGSRPTLEAPESALPGIIRSSPRWEEVAFSCSGETCVEREPEGRLPATLSSGIFRSGAIDLTGDGQPEEIRLENSRVSIYSNGRLDWQTPPEWRVLDLALGDSDEDGRGDLVLALEKPDNRGEIQSHPFVIGYRGGVYRTMWGGSAVRDPLKEVELGDVNGDGQSELIVLEQERSGKGRAVTVWHWHGWGFSLDWRSAYAEYEDMRLDGQEIRARRLQE